MTLRLFMTGVLIAVIIFKKKYPRECDDLD